MKRKYIGLTAIIIACLFFVMASNANADFSAHNETVDWINNPVLIESVITSKAIVRVKLVENVIASEYCFQTVGTYPMEDSYDWIEVNANSFQVFKYDGEYDLYIRTEDGTVSSPYYVNVESGYHYVIDHYDIDGNEIPPLNKNLVAVAEDNGTSIEELNEKLFLDVMNAGQYTREGVATAGVSAISLLADMGYAIPYCANQAFQGENDWGFNKYWGGKLSEPQFNEGAPSKLYWHNGMQCVGGCTWAYKQAGIALSNASVTWVIGRMGERKYENDNIIDYRKCKTGDLMQVNAHYRMLIDRLDTDKDGVCDAYLSFEMDAPTMCCRIIYFDWLWYRNLFYNMDAVFENAGRFNCSICYTEKNTIISDTPINRMINTSLEMCNNLISETVETLYQNMAERDAPLFYLSHELDATN